MKSNVEIICSGIAEKVNQFFSSFTTIAQKALPEILKQRNNFTAKRDGSFVSQGDILIQQLTINHINNFLPDSFLISEELCQTEKKESDNEVVFILDPIDGTENFVSGFAEWGTSISCYFKNYHVASLLGCPEMGLWLQTGCKLNRFSSRIRGLSSSLSRDDLMRATQGYEYRITGCCVYNMLNVIRGSFHSFENPKGAHSWDILAGLNLALEHGLTVNVEGGAYAGEYLSPDRKYRFKIENQ